MAVVFVMVLAFWCTRFYTDGITNCFEVYKWEIFFSAIYFISALTLYFGWLRSKLMRSVQVYEDHLMVQSKSSKDNIHYADIETVQIVCWSIFYIKMKSGTKFYFNSSLERVDYIWEGIWTSRPDLIEEKAYESFKIKLVQYDHHQKRKEWFFKHKLLDVFNWTILPLIFLGMAYFVQSQYIVIHQQGLYFFRLMMFALFVIIACSFVFSSLLKKVIFDKKVLNQIKKSELKTRDLEFEGVILERSKIFQVFTTCFVMAVLIKTDANLFSVSKVREDIVNFKLKKGHTILVDNRFNCLGCKFQLNDGDFVVFGRGTIGQVLAKEGDMVGEIAQNEKGRMIASDNVQEVPKGHLAVKAANGKDIVFIKIEELIGKIQN